MKKDNICELHMCVLPKTEPSAVSTINFGEYIKKVISFLARNFFTMKFIALSIAFLINFMLLFYKVPVQTLTSKSSFMIS